LKGVFMIFPDGLSPAALYRMDQVAISPEAGNDAPVSTELVAYDPDILPPAPEGTIPAATPFFDAVSRQYAGLVELPDRQPPAHLPITVVALSGELFDTSSPQSSASILQPVAPEGVVSLQLESDRPTIPRRELVVATSVSPSLLYGPYRVTAETSQPDEPLEIIRGRTVPGDTFTEMAQHPGWMSLLGLSDHPQHRAARLQACIEQPKLTGITEEMVPLSQNKLKIPY
jgi:hypothetical protein